MIVTTLGIITELSKSRTAHGGCVAAGGGGLVRRFGKQERTPTPRQKQEKKPHEIA